MSTPFTANAIPNIKNYNRPKPPSSPLINTQYNFTPQVSCPLPSQPTPPLPTQPECVYYYEQANPPTQAPFQTFQQPITVGLNQTQLDQLIQAIRQQIGRLDPLTPLKNQSKNENLKNQYFNNGGMGHFNQGSNGAFFGNSLGGQNMNQSYIPQGFNSGFGATPNTGGSAGFGNAGQGFGNAQNFGNRGQDFGSGEQGFGNAGQGTIKLNVRNFLNLNKKN